jgi:hypothetical protein
MLTPEKPMFTPAFLALVLSQVADVLTTKAVLSAGGREMNKFMLKLAEFFGGNVLIPATILKLVVLVFVFFAPFPQPIVWGMAGVFGAASVWNYYQYRKQLKINAAK